MPVPIRFKRGNFANLPALGPGEPAFTLDTNEFYVGLNSTTDGNKFFGSHRYWTRETGTTGSGINLVEGTDNGSAFLTLRAPGALAGITTFTFPAVDGSANNILVTDGSGNLSFTNDINISSINITGIATFASNVNINAGLDVTGIITAASFRGDGSQLTGIDATTLKDENGVVRLQANTSGAVATGIITATKFVGDIDGTVTTAAQPNITSVGTLTNLSVSGNVSIAGTLTYEDVTNVDSVGLATARIGLDVLSGGVNVSGASTFSNNVDFNSGIDVSGIVTATSFEGNQVIGTPSGGFKSGAFTINNTDHTKDSINELNFILGKLVPIAPDTLNSVTIALTGTVGSGHLCQGFTPTNNTGGAAPSAGNAYTRNTDSTITTEYINDVGPGDAGQAIGFVNAVGVGTIAFDSNVNNGTSDALQVKDNKDASESVRNPGITSNFYQVYDVRMINAPSPDGYNKAFFTHGSATSDEVFWYEDPSTVGAPVISYSSVNTPSSSGHTVAYSSGVPHYTESTNNNFTYVATVENASGDMYSYSNFKLLNSDGATTGFSNPGHKLYSDFAGGANPPVRNFGVGTGVTTLMTHTPNNIHNTITSNHFSRFDAVTPYGSHNNQRVSFSTNVNIMGTIATTSQIDEDNILISSLGTGSGNATRVNAGSTGDNPTPIFTSWTASSSVATYESVVRGGVLRHDQTNYSNYLPVGPDYSSGRSGTQYFQIELIRSNVSEFSISYTGSAAGCFVCMPDNSAWTSSLSGTNGWADMFQAYRGSGLPTSAEPGCSSGGVMDTNGGTFTCVFGTESSSNDSNNRILIRWKLTSGQSITAMSFSAT
jgi:hypothetical protein